MGEANRRHSMRILLILLLSSLVITPSVFGRSSLAEYDFSWLDPDKKIYVIQNRKYLKEGKFEFAASLGRNFKQIFLDNTIYQGRGTYYFSEQWGISFIGITQKNVDNQTYQNLKGSEVTPSYVPNIRAVTRILGGTLQWLPFYGKFNFFNTILYVDWHLEMGVAELTEKVNTKFEANDDDNAYKEYSYTAFLLGSGWKFFLSRRFALRLDGLISLYQAPDFSKGVIKDPEKKWRTEYQATLGLAVHL